MKNILLKMNSHATFTDLTHIADSPLESTYITVRSCGTNHIWADISVFVHREANNKGLFRWGH